MFHFGHRDNDNACASRAQQSSPENRTSHPVGIWEILQSIPVCLFVSFDLKLEERNELQSHLFNSWKIVVEVV